MQTMYILTEKFIVIKLIQMVISTHIGGAASDYKIEVPNINVRFWQTPLRESIYQSIARHRVYKGENLDERQEFDRMLWGKIRVARFMKRLDVTDVSEALRTGVLVTSVRGEYEFRQTDHSIYDCVGRKCRSDNVLQAVWRVQQMNEPYTLYIGIKIPNYQRYHFEPTEDIYLFTVEKGLKRLRYQQNNTKKWTGKLIYDPFVSSRLTVQTTRMNQTITLTESTMIPLEVTTAENSPATNKLLATIEREKHSETELGAEISERIEDGDHIQRTDNNTSDRPFSLQNPSTRTIPSVFPIFDENAFLLTENEFQSDSSPSWALSPTTTPSWQKNLADWDHFSSTDSDNLQKTTSIFDEPKEVIITPKPFRGSTQFQEFSEQKYFHCNEDKAGKSSQNSKRKPAVIINPQEESEKTETASGPFWIKTINAGPGHFVKNNTDRAFEDKQPEVFKTQKINSTRRLSTQRRNFSARKNITRQRKKGQIKGASIGGEKIQDKRSNTNAVDANMSRSQKILSIELKNRFLKPTTYHPTFNIADHPRGRKMQSYLPTAERNGEILGNTDYWKIYNYQENNDNVDEFQKSGRVHKRHEKGHYATDNRGETEPWISSFETDTPEKHNFAQKLDELIDTTPQYEEHTNETTQEPSFEGKNDTKNSTTHLEGVRVEEEQTPLFETIRDLLDLYDTDEEEFDDYDYTTIDSTDSTEPITEKIYVVEMDDLKSNVTPQTENSKREIDGGNDRQFEAVTDEFHEFLENTEKDNEPGENSETLGSERQKISPLSRLTSIERREDNDAKNVPETEDKAEGDQSEVVGQSTNEKNCQFCDEIHSSRENKNASVSVIVSRLTKTVSQKFKNGTEMQLANLPIYMKKKLKRLKSFKGKDKD